MAREVLEILRVGPSGPLASGTARIRQRRILDIGTVVDEVAVVGAVDQVRPATGILAPIRGVGTGRQEDLVNRARVRARMCSKVLEHLALEHMRARTRA